MAQTDASKYKNCPNPAEGEDFQTATPEEVGLDAAALKAAADFHTQKLQETFFVLRFGCLVQTGNLNALFEQTPKHQWSVTKGVSTAVLGRALTMGLLSVEDTVGKYFPDEGDEKHRAVTVRQLLNHTQGTHMQWTREFQVAFNPDRVKEFMSLPFDHEPGEYFEYSQTGPAVLNAIVEKAVGKDFQEFAQEQLFAKLGIPRANWFWLRDAHGWTEGYSHLHMRPLDMVRFGQFLQQGMAWRGEQLVDPGFVADSKKGTESNPAFGYQTWINRAPRHITIGLPKREEEMRPVVASAPQDMTFTWGWRGRHQFVMPSLGLLVVSTPFDHDYDYEDVNAFPLNQGEQREGYHEFFRYLMRAVNDQQVKDPGPWSGGTKDMDNVDGEQFVEPEQTLASRENGAPEATGMTKAGEDIVQIWTNPAAGPFVPLH